MTFLTLLARSPRLARAVPQYAEEIGAEAKVLAAAGLPHRSALALAARYRLTHRFVPSPHYVSELTLVAAAVIERRDQPGHVIELGAYKGSSAAKLSSACRLAGKRLWVFDSFEGLPEPAMDDAEHQIEGRRCFTRGDYAGSLEEVRRPRLTRHARERLDELGHPHSGAEGRVKLTVRVVVGLA